MPSWKKPTDEDVRRAVALLGHPERLRYFLERLTNPHWLLPLEAAGFFRVLPAAEFDDSRTTVGFPNWPAGTYLARVAAHVPDSAQVVRLILALPKSDNPRVYERIAEAATGLAPDLAAKVVPKLNEVFDLPILLLVPDRLGALIFRLATGGRVKEALSLSREALRLRPDAQAKEGPRRDHVVRSLPEPVARLDQHGYKDFLTLIGPSLLQAAPLEFLKMACNLLHDAVVHSQWEPKKSQPEDYSTTWRRHLDAPTDFDIRDALVTTCRDLALELLQRGTPTAADVISELESHRWNVFQRLSLHSLAHRAALAGALVAERIERKDLFHAYSSRREYALLVERGFPLVPASTREAYLLMVRDGPDLERFEHMVHALHGRAPSQAERDLHLAEWHVDRLSFISGSLPPDLMKALRDAEELLSKEGPRARDLDDMVQIGLRSPRTAEEIQAMPADELVAFLKEWRATGDVFGHSIDGLGQQLTLAISRAPNILLPICASVDPLDEVLQRSLLHGARDACRSGTALDWDLTLSMASKTLSSSGTDTGGIWTKQAVVDLLTSGMQATHSIPLRLREDAWRLLATLAAVEETPMDSSDGHERALPNSPDSAIGTLRGQAVEALIQFSQWAVRASVSPDAHGPLPTGSIAAPEAFETLAGYLSPGRDAAFVARTVLGSRFLSLLKLDRHWSAAHVGDIFPMEPGREPLRDAAWAAYVVRSTAYTDVYELLQPQYRVALDDLLAATGTSKPPAVHEALVEHLMRLYWYGALGLESGGLLDSFFRLAPDSLRGRAFQVLGRNLMHMSEPAPSDALVRVMSLWDWRTPAREPAAGPEGKEASALGWLVGSGKIDPVWSLARLESSLRTGVVASPEVFVGAELARLSKTYPLASVTCLGLMVENDRTRWLVLSLSDHIRPILESAISSAEPNCAAEAIRLINRLGALGHHEYKDLLPGA